MVEQITQPGWDILRNFFRKKKGQDVIVRGRDGKPIVVQPGPTIISGVEKHPERPGGGKGIQHPDSDGEPR